MESTQADFVPILLHIIFCTIMICLVIAVSNKLGPKHTTKNKSENFECGIDPIGDTRHPFAIRYFLTAILFVLFDIEIIFMYPWAIDYFSSGTGGLLKMGGFMVVLFVGYLYIVKRKALDWEN
jgi:NADH:ubiquinone oxidoreductase subunit 3 (chain A)